MTRQSSAAGHQATSRQQTSAAYDSILKRRATEDKANGHHGDSNAKQKPSTERPRSIRAAATAGAPAKGGAPGQRSSKPSAPLRSRPRDSLSQWLIKPRSYADIHKPRKDQPPASHPRSVATATIPTTVEPRVSRPSAHSVSNIDVSESPEEWSPSTIRSSQEHSFHQAGKAEASAGPALRASKTQREADQSATEPAGPTVSAPGHSLNQQTGQPPGGGQSLLGQEEHKSSWLKGDQRREKASAHRLDGSRDKSGLSEERYWQNTGLYSSLTRSHSGEAGSIASEASEKSDSFSDWISQASFDRIASPAKDGPSVARAASAHPRSPHTPSTGTETSRLLREPIRPTPAVRSSSLPVNSDLCAETYLKQALAHKEEEVAKLRDQLLRNDMKTLKEMRNDRERANRLQAQNLQLMRVLTDLPQCATEVSVICQALSEHLDKGDMGPVLLQPLPKYACTVPEWLSDPKASPPSDGDTKAFAESSQAVMNAMKGGLKALRGAVEEAAVLEWSQELSKDEACQVQ